MDQDYTKLLEKYPFLSHVAYGGNDYLGVIQNVDDIFTTIYDVGVLKTTEQKVRFMELADIWWWESNRQIPINVFLKSEWSIFTATLRTLNSKDVEIKFGPYISLKEISVKRSKRRSITLIKKL